VHQREGQPRGVVPPVCAQPKGLDKSVELSRLERAAKRSWQEALQKSARAALDRLVGGARRQCTGVARHALGDLLGQFEILLREQRRHGLSDGLVVEARRHKVGWQLRNHSVNVLAEQVVQGARVLDA